MSFQDFVSNYQKLEICNLGPESLSEDAAAQKKKRWEMVCHDGAWTKRVNAGGCRNYLGEWYSRFVRCCCSSSSCCFKPCLSIRLNLL